MTSLASIAITIMLILLLKSALIRCQQIPAADIKPVLEYEPEYYRGDVVFDLDFKYTPNNDRSVTIHLFEKVRKLPLIRYQELVINITYYLSHHHSIPRSLCIHQEMIKSIMSQDFQPYGKYCLKNLFKFSRYNETNLDDPLEILKYCDKRERIFNVSALDKEDTLKIKDLLPNLQYTFVLTTVGPKFVSEPVARQVCTNASAPMYPPHSDLGSFYLLTRDLKIAYDESQKQTFDDGTNHSLRLYWRPVPRELVGSEDANYYLVCRLASSQDFLIHEPVHDFRIGHFDITKPQKSSYLCMLAAENNLGVTQYTYINIPDSKHIIKLDDDFKFYVVNIAENRFKMRWTSINPRSTTIDATTPAPPIHNGYYTIYWCYSNPLGDCESLTGLLKTNLTHYELELPGVLDDKALRFGISYFDEQKITTGIIWTKCIAHMNRHTISRPMNLFKPTLKRPDDYHSITISWNFQHCEALSAFIRAYEINYCAISQISDCSVIYSNPSDEKFLRYQSEKNPDVFGRFFEDHSCAVSNISDPLVNLATIKNLSSSTGYIIRARYILANETSNPWSDPIFLHTTVDPTKNDKCWRTLSLISLAVIVIFFVAGIFVYPRSKRWLNHYYSILFRFNRTRSSVTKLVASIPKMHDTGEMALKYCVNRTTDCHSRADSVASTDTTAERDSDEFKRAITSTSEVDYNATGPASISTTSQVAFMPIFDYVPANLLDGHFEPTPADKLSDSLKDLSNHEFSSQLDETSIKSDLSFLEHILDGLSIDEASNPPSAEEI